MRSVEYRGLEIPIFNVQSFSMDRIVMENEYQNYWLKHSQLFNVDVSFFIDDLDEDEESVLSNLEYENVLFKFTDFYQVLYVREVSKVERYSIADCGKIGEYLNVINYNFISELSDLDYDSLLRCIKIQNILNH
jgi:hypothetical protein